mmetsp:Transcript_33667/g.81629  ORF Transcript_33667/g.81629 Transcript_33667/m.81629 type:complete len:223 (-) Transcript_33667:1125-1793(-)
MLVIDILGDSSKQTHGKGHFAMLMSKNTGSHTLDNPVSNAIVLCQIQNVTNVLFRQVGSTRGISSFAHMVSREKGGKDGESRLESETGIIGLFVDTSNFNLFSWPGNVNQIIRQKDLLGTGHSAGRDRTRSFLQIDSLKVAVQALRCVQLEASDRVAHGTLVRLVGIFYHSSCRLHPERPLSRLAIQALVDSLLKLRVHIGSTGDHSMHLDEAFQVGSSQVS